MEAIFPDLSLHPLIPVRDAWGVPWVRARGGEETFLGLHSAGRAPFQKPTNNYTFEKLEAM